MRMRKPASASADAEKTRFLAAQDVTQDISQDISQDVTQYVARGTETVCLALLVALAALVCRIASIW